jgi:hypothetical protein
MSEALVLSELKWKDEPVAAAGALRARHTPQFLALLREHKMVVDLHFSKYQQADRVDVRESCDLKPFIPITEADVAQPFGLWSLPRIQTQYAAPEDGSQRRMPHRMITKLVAIGGGSFELALDIVHRPWFGASGAPTAGHDLEMRATLMRMPTGGVQGADGPINLYGHVQLEGLIDRWSMWQRVALGPGESFTFELGDLRDFAKSEWGTTLTVLLHLTVRRRG